MNSLHVILYHTVQLFKDFPEMSAKVDKCSLPESSSTFTVVSHQVSVTMTVIVLHLDIFAVSLLVFHRKDLSEARPKPQVCSHFQMSFLYLS